MNPDLAELAVQETIEQVLFAYVKEQSHPDCLPSHRFKGILPSGLSIFGPTREGVEARVWAAIQATRSTEERS
jgi:hypothetical protein